MKLLGKVEKQRRNKTEKERLPMNRTIRISTVICAAMLLSGCLDPKFKEGER